MQIVGTSAVRLQPHLPPYHILDLQERVERTPGAFTLALDGWAEQRDYTCHMAVSFAADAASPDMAHAKASA